jgi:alpha-L-rhamnosidase
MPAIKINQTINPVKLTSPEPNVYVYDMGQLYGGWIKLKVKGPKGTQVTIKYSDRIFDGSGLIDKRRHAKGDQTDYYILKGDEEGEYYEPRFTYHPVRYIQIEGYPGEPTVKDVEGRVVYSAIDIYGDFNCSNPLLNQIHKNVVWTFTNGLFGIPLDCLDREHWAWTDPATVTGSLYPRKFMPVFWTKWLKDIADSQHEDGAIPVVTPSYPSFADSQIDAAWGGNYPILVWYLYQYYEDSLILEEHYPEMTKWMNYLSSISEKHIVTKGHFGDHMLPGDFPGDEQFVSKETPPQLVWTGYYYLDASIISQIARILGKTEDADYYHRLAEDIKDAFNKQWFDTNANYYVTGSQTANIFPLILGIIPEGNKDAVLKNIISSIEEKYKGRLHTGNTGTTCMIDALTENGYGDVMYRVVNSTEYPGWGYMVKEGATTIWEGWSAESRAGSAASMIMWATIDEFFYNDLAGIKGPEYYGPRFMTPGFREIQIKPYVPGDLEYSNASIKTVRGIISSGWKKTDNSLNLDVTIPVNATASVSVPVMELKNITITEGGKVVWKDGAYVSGVEGITGGKLESGYVTFDTGSGEYQFKVQNNDDK